MDFYKWIFYLILFVTPIELCAKPLWVNCSVKHYSAINSLINIHCGFDTKPNRIIINLYKLKTKSDENGNLFNKYIVCKEKSYSNLECKFDEISIECRLVIFLPLGYYYRVEISDINPKPTKSNVIYVNHIKSILQDYYDKNEPNTIILIPRTQKNNNLFSVSGNIKPIIPDGKINIFKPIFSWSYFGKNIKDLVYYIYLFDINGDIIWAKSINKTSIKYDGMVSLKKDKKYHWIIGAKTIESIVDFDSKIPSFHISK